MSAPQVTLIPVLKDNYSYLVSAASQAVVIDPGEPTPVLAELKRQRLTLRAVLCTHGHWDHVGGAAALRALDPSVQVLASEAENVAGMTGALCPGDALAFGPLAGRVLDLAAHTLGHLGFLFEDALFTGDALFVAGCGRLFEGSPADLARVVATLAALPPTTRVFCGHEYTLTNLAFAHTLEPENPEVALALSRAQQARQDGRPTVPTTLADERRYNPFLRASSPAIQRAVGETEPVAVLAALRSLKDRFRAPQ